MSSIDQNVYIFTSFEEGQLDEIAAYKTNAAAMERVEEYKAKQRTRFIKNYKDAKVEIYDSNDNVKRMKVIEFIQKTREDFDRDANFTIIDTGFNDFDKVMVCARIITAIQTNIPLDVAQLDKLVFDVHGSDATYFLVNTLPLNEAHIIV